MATGGIYGGMAAAGVSARRLAEALREIGIEFPAMMPDLPSEDVPMIRLGRIQASTADALTRWITSHRETIPTVPASPYAQGRTPDAGHNAQTHRPEPPLQHRDH